MKYHTKQHEAILMAAKAIEHSFTPKELSEHLEGVGLTTIYRALENFATSGQLKKTYTDDAVRYQYLSPCAEDNHFYLTCNKCHNVFHVDCDCVGDFYQHISGKHHFLLDHNNILITGICEKCQEEYEENH
jgi:Fe2+ or Zn2+ uptake regulation protein